MEGRSIYDIDASLTSKGLIHQGEYIVYTTSPEKISALSERYDFFDANLKSLEGFLYPDTYHIDAKANVVKDLVSIQLNTFKKKVREGYESDFSAIGQKYGLDTYHTIILASIVEKEEKNSENKSTVAGIFYNRLQRGMKIEADITLCYNFKKPYVDCTPSVIVKNLSDEKNPYNTRRVGGLPPTPIANPDVDTLKAILFPQKTSYLFYLHDSS
ncbi:MAG: endolytic transglycosylase MltG [Candidatus Peribacteria bacterium]|nr:endolytic transglycosylase MltG [Candidatus Peribacteria bacterium]